MALMCSQSLACELGVPWLRSMRVGSSLTVPKLALVLSKPCTRWSHACHSQTMSAVPESFGANSRIISDQRPSSGMSMVSRPAARASSAEKCSHAMAKTCPSSLTSMSWWKRAVLSFREYDQRTSLSQVRRSTVCPPPPAQMASLANTCGR